MTAQCNSITFAWFLNDRTYAVGDLAFGRAVLAAVRTERFVLSVLKGRLKGAYVGDRVTSINDALGYMCGQRAAHPRR